MRRVGVSWLRKVNATELKAMTEPIEICHQNQPLRVMVPYALLLQWQDHYEALTKQLETAEVKP